MKKGIVLIITLTFFSRCGERGSISSIESSYPGQEFHINNSIDTTVFSKAGIRLFIPANAFYFNDSLPEKNITLKLIEIVKGPLPLREFPEFSKCTDTATAIIELKALSKTKELKLNKDHFLTIHIPKSYGYKNMRLYFSGDSERSCTWIPDTSAAMIPESFKVVYERMDFSSLPDKSTPVRRMWFKDTTAYKNFEQYFDYNFDTKIINHGNFDSIPPHINFKVNNTGVIYDIKFTRTTDTSFMNKMTSFFGTAPRIDLSMLAPGDTSSKEFGMTFEKRHGPPPYQCMAGYMYSFTNKEPDYAATKVQYFSEAVNYYNIFNTQHTGWIILKK